MNTTTALTAAQLAHGRNLHRIPLPTIEEPPAGLLPIIKREQELFDAFDEAWIELEEKMTACRTAATREAKAFDDAARKGTKPPTGDMVADAEQALKLATAKLRVRRGDYEEFRQSPKTRDAIEQVAPVVLDMLATEFEQRALARDADLNAARARDEAHRTALFQVVGNLQTMREYMPHLTADLNPGLNSVPWPTAPTSRRLLHVVEQLRENSRVKTA